MSNKKNYTIEELTKAYEEAKRNFNTLHQQLEEMKREEADKKRIALEREKEKRMAEIDEAVAHLKNLYNAYIEDYGYIEMTTKTDGYDWWPSFWRSNFWF